VARIIELHAEVHRLEN